MFFVESTCYGTVKYSINTCNVHMVIWVAKS